MSPSAHANPFAAFHFRGYRLFQLARLKSTIAMQIQAVALGWEVYALRGDALDLGYVGLALFLPSLLFAAVTGHTADRRDRRQVLFVSNGVLLLASSLLLYLVGTQRATMASLLVILALVGTARAFQGPAAQALMPNLVPAHVFPNAVAWGSSTWQVSVVAGPAIGGIVYSAFGALGAFALVSLLELLTLGVLLGIPADTPRDVEAGPRASRDLAAGLRFVWANPIILGAISLDLFAVLFGGAVALLPIYARDILAAGPQGLGILRSAPAIGALVVAVWLAYRPITRRAGRLMLLSVGLFGVATIVFGMSRNLTLSVVALAVSGAADMVSVFIRHSVVQLSTPDAMRGRVAAVNLIFIGASNELGEFESGVAAHWLGTVPAVLLGGIATIAVVIAWAAMFPALRSVDKLSGSSV